MRGIMIRNTMICAVSALALIGSASAADIYRNEGGSLKDAPYVPVNTWTGFYIGGNGGYVWNTDSNVLTFTGSDNLGVDQNGGFGGGQIGYNWQRDKIVYGLEADFQGAGLSDSGKQSITNNAQVVFSGAAKSEMDWFGTVRGRLGYSFDRSLLYFTGGFAYGNVKNTLSLTATDGGSTATTVLKKEDTKTGYVLGGGLEYSLTPAWSLKGEYQYLHLGSEKLSGTAAADTGEDVTTGSAKFEDNFHTVRVGLNYHIHQGYEPLK
jgi:outer membrane immunogenic protein